MANQESQVGRLEFEPVRDLFRDEARSFTAWLEEHVEVPGERLGLELDLAQRRLTTLTALVLASASMLLVPMPLRRLLWLTDLHLDHCEPAAVDAFVASVRRSRPDALLVGGDTGTAPTLEQHLRRLAADVDVPVFFVLGNHDFYHGSFQAARARVEQLCSKSCGRLTWLSRTGVVELDPDTALVGHDGWADGRFGDCEGSGVRLNDHRLIREFIGLGSLQRLALMQELAEAAAEHLRSVLPEALDRCSRVIVLTHVPPFKEAAWHQGAQSDPDYLPHFASKIVGDTLRAAMATHSDRHMLVLCGHTHSEGRVRVIENLDVVTGGADYGAPVAQGFIDLPNSALDVVPIVEDVGRGTGAGRSSKPR